MEWNDILIALISAVCSGGGVLGIVRVREEKKKTPYDMVVEMLNEQKKFYAERNAEYEKEKRDSAEKSAVIMQTHKCQHKYSDPKIICPVDVANESRLKDRCDRCGYGDRHEDID